MASFASHPFRAVILSLAIFGSIAVLRAQSENGQIRVEVRDPSGTPVEASGRLQDLTRGTERSFTTNSQGAYQLTSLPYGRYRLEITRSGFATQSFTIDVRAAAPVRCSITLALAPQATRIDVVAATPLPGTDLPLEEIPAPVQTASARDLERSGSLDLSDLLNQRLERRAHQSEPGESVSARCELPRLYCLAFTGDAGGDFRIHGRRPAESAFRRHRGVGPDP